MNKLWTLLGLNPTSLKSKQTRWFLGIGAAVMVLIGLALLLLLTISTNNRAQYEDTYGQLLIVNTVVASLIVVADFVDGHTSGCTVETGQIW